MDWVFMVEKENREKDMHRNSNIMGVTKTNAIMFINDLINTAITYTADDHRDHWQTLSQSMARALGDCDDYACAKFHMLHDAGLEPHLMACYIDGVSHMVCVCDGYVMDNVNTSLLPLADRTDLSKSVYTLYLDRMECDGKVLPVTNHTKWCDWIKRSGLDA